MEKHKSIGKLALALALALLAAPLAQASAQATVHDVFRAMPDSILPSLTTNNRLDMVDFFDSNMRATVVDRLDTEATLDTLAADYLRLTLAGGVVAELKMLPTDEPADSAGYRLCLVRSYGEPAMESSVSLYSSQWRKLEAPALADDEAFKQSLLQRPDTVPPEEYARRLAALPMLTVSFSLSPDAATLVATPHFPLLTGEEKQLEDYLAPRTLTWDGATGFAATAKP